MASYISEIKLKQGLRKVAIISFASLVILSLFAFATFKVVSYVYTSANDSELKATQSEFAITIKRKAMGELRALRTLAMFTKKSDDITKTYSAVGKENIPFDVVGFWNLDGTCEQVSISGVKTDTAYKNLPPQVKLAISTAWLGQSTVSSPYFSPTIGQDMITYVAPVFANDGRVIGALSGAVSQVTFDANLEQISVTNPDIDSFLTTASGFIFSSGVNEVIPRDLHNVSDFKGFTRNAIDKIRVGLVSTTPTSFTTNINGLKYNVTLTPLDFADWYLGTISSAEVKHSPYFQSLSFLIVSIVIIFTVCCFIAIYLFINMKSSYKTQLLIAHYDPVTDAYNYNKFLLEFANLDYKESPEIKYAVVSLSMQDFSYMQDMLGEKSSDDLLRTIANIFREQDTSKLIMFCHHEKDQFYLVYKIKEQDKLNAELIKLINICTQRINAEISSIPIVMCAGVAFAHHDLSPDKVVARSEFARKQINKTYTHAIRFYDENAYKKEAFLHSIEKSMRAALENEEFKLFLQPKIDLKTGKIYAAEALVRWISESDTIVYPNDFIPLFEANGFCTELDLYMFDKACARIRSYLDRGIEPIYLSINQTKLLFFKKGYKEQLKLIIDKYDIPPKYLMIEVLEDLATYKVNELNNHINELKKLGLSIALDDFGSGYSSLNIIAGLDLDEIKFDREFMLAHDPEQIEKNHMILRVLSKLAKELGIRTVVEGVERNEDVEFLKTIDCDLAQGYYYDRPIPADDFDRKYILPEGSRPKATYKPTRPIGELPSSRISAYSAAASATAAAAAADKANAADTNNAEAAGNKDHAADNANAADSKAAEAKDSNNAAPSDATGAESTDSAK